MDPESKITVLGINSRFGKAVSFLLKQSPIVNRLVLYDESDTEVAHDISAINTTCKVVVYNGEEQLRCAVKNSDVILIGDKEDPVPNVDETISKAAPDVIKYAEAISCAAPNAIVLVATYPVNSMLSLFSEVQIRNGTFDCDRVMGVTSVDTMRASTVLANHLNLEPEKVYLPVIGGSSPDTRIPLFSQSRPSVTACKADLRKMTRLVKMSECELFKLLNRGDALNKAYSTVRFIDSVMSALRGHRNISEIVLSRTCLVPDVDYFSLPVILGPKGIAHRFPIPTLTERENILLEHAIKCIQVDKQKAIDVMSRRARSNQCQTPEKAKEYSDLVDCDKKGIFVGALLDRLKTRKETCQPKLEYLLMCKNNDLVYPPDSEPSLSPERIKFVEPDQVPNDGCCPVKLPCPPSPPKRGLTVIAPKRSKCKVVVSPCPYPPVVKLPKTCNTCRTSPCDHYESCKSLYGDSKCCSNARPQPGNKSILTSKSERPEIQQVPSWNQSDVSDQVSASQQVNCCVQTLDNHQCAAFPQPNIMEVPQMTTLDSSMPLATQDTGGEVKPVGSPSVTYPSASSDSHCPYGMSYNSQALNYSNTPPPVVENNAERTIYQYNHAAANVSTSQSDVASSPRHVDFSEPVEIPVHQNSPSNQEMFIQPGEKHFFSPDATNSSQHSCFSKAECHEFVPRTIDRSIDKCLSEKCLVGAKPGVASSSPPLENNLGTTAIEHANVAGSAMKFSDMKTPYQNPETPAQPLAYYSQNNTKSRSPGMLPEHGNNSFVEPLQQSRVSSPSANFNYKGGLGISSSKLERHPDNSYLCFNPWSAHREEQYYNEQLAANAKPHKKKNGSTNMEETINPNEKQACEMPKPVITEKMELERRAVQENKFGNDTSTQNTVGLEVGTISNTPVAGHSKLVTEVLSSYRTTMTETEKQKNDLVKPTPGPKCRDEVRDGHLESEIIKEGISEDTGTNALVSETRMRENIKSYIENARMQESDKRKADKTKILGFGQIISTFIPAKRFSKRTEEKSNKMTTPSQTQPQKLYVETHCNLQADKPKETKGNVVLLPIAPSNDHKDSTEYRTENDPSGLRRTDIDPEVSKIAHIRYKVQEALKSVILPPKYTQKPAEVVKREKYVERILREKLRRASKAVNKNVREMRKVDPAYAPVSQKLYAPKCPSDFLFGSHPDSRVVTFNNVQEYDIPRPKKEKVKSAGSGFVDQHVKTGFMKGEELSVESSTVGEEQVKTMNVTGTTEIYTKAADCPVVHYPDYWSKPQKHEYQAPPSKSSQMIQNQLVPIQLKTARPKSRSEHLKQVLAYRTEERVKVNLDQLESIIKERSKKVMTPGGFRLARMDDPKYGLTSPNRLTSNR